ncbi:MAG: hypothetical protein QOI66_148 [Myxococcales bacterium]|nr:hypothetical protein [Myxococcales bacterium]
MGGSGGAMSGTGGTVAGTGGTVAGTGGMTMPGGSQTVGQRGGDPGRTGHFIRPMLTKAKAATMATDATFMTSYLGALSGVPLYAESGPGGKGAFFVATQANNVYAFDETTGAQLWMKNVGPTATGGCDGQSKGIMSTPALDPVSRTLYVVAANGAGTFMTFQVYALNSDNGQQRWVKDLRLAMGEPAPDLTKSNQRGALLLVNGILYIPFGGQMGDCAGARGHVVAINTADNTKIGAWATGDDGSGIWAPGGMASDGTGTFAVTGNHFPNLSAPDTHADSEQVVRLTDLAQVARSNNNIFFPNRWAAMDSGNLDFGACSPLVMDVPGATPARFVAAASKDGHLYFLDPANLGGMGGEKFDLQFAAEAMSALKTTPASYVTASGAYVVLSTQGAQGCPAAGGTVVVGVKVTVAAGAIKPTVAWCSSVAGETSPIVTTTDDKTDAVVWWVDGGNLKGVDGDTGAMVFSGGGACSVQRWTSPIAARGARIVAGGAGKLCSWSAM